MGRFQEMWYGCVHRAAQHVFKFRRHDFLRRHLTAIYKVEIPNRAIP